MMKRSAPASVQFRSVIKRYGSVVAVDDVSFTIEPSTLVTLLGPSGCGKTTTLRLIAGLEIASEGQILIGDKDVTHLSAAERDVSMVFQSYALFPHRTVAENVAFGLRMRDVPKPEIERRVKAALWVASGSSQSGWKEFMAVEVGQVSDLTYFVSDSSRFITWLQTIVQAASCAGLSLESAFDSPTAMSSLASSAWA